MSTEKSKRWSEKYRSRDKILSKEEPFLRENIALLDRNCQILDLACGDGRNAIYLLKEGYDVLGVDFSDEALKRLEYFASSENLNPKIMKLDLENLQELLKLGEFGTILINHYKPSDKIFKNLDKLLLPNGILIMCTFNYRQNLEKGFPRKYCLEENELVDFNENLKLIKHEVREDNYGYVDGYIFRKI